MDYVVDYQRDEASFRLPGHSCVAGMRLAGCFYMPSRQYIETLGFARLKSEGTLSWDCIGGVTASRRPTPESGSRYPINLWRMRHDGERRI